MAETDINQPRAGRFRSSRYPGFYGGRTDETSGNLVAETPTIAPNPLTGAEAAALNPAPAAAEPEPSLGGPTTPLGQIGNPEEGGGGDGGLPGGETSPGEPTIESASLGFGDEYMEMSPGARVGTSLIGAALGPVGSAASLGYGAYRGTNNLTYLNEEAERRNLPAPSFGQRMGTLAGFDFRKEALGISPPAVDIEPLPPLLPEPILYDRYDATLVGGEGGDQLPDNLGTSPAERAQAMSVPSVERQDLGGSSGGYDETGGTFTGPDVGRFESAPAVEVQELAPTQQVAASDGGGGGESRVICTHLVRLGLMDAAMQRLDAKFTFRTLTPIHARGYHAWAVPYVRLMRKPGIAGRLAVAFMEPIARWRMEEIAFLAGDREAGNWKGKIVRRVFEPFSYLVGLMVEDDGRWRSLYATQKGHAHACR